MRKFYSLIAFVVLSVVSLTASAAYDLPEDETAFLATEAYNMRLVKAYNFVDWTVNGEAIEGTGFTFGEQNVALPLMNLTAGGPFPVTNVGLENMYAQGTYLRKTANGMDTSGQSGPRWIGFNGMSKGTVIVIQATVGSTNKGEQRYNDENGNSEFIIANAYRYNVNSDWAMHFYNENDQSMQVEVITDEVHAAQDADLEEGQESKADGFFYFRVLEDGPVYFAVGRNAVVQGIQFWMSNDAAEAITPPSMKVVGVDGEARQLEFKPGESTYGNKVVTYYSTDGDDPVFLKDSEEIDHYEGDDPVYKKVLDESQFVKDDETGTIWYGPNAPFNAEDGYIYVDASDDEDGDGKVTVKAVSVSESTRVISAIQEIEVYVGEIQLNEPTLTLAGINGTERTYKMTWNNNTLCGEPYDFIFENGEDLYVEYEWDSETNSNPAFDATFSSETTIKMTVRVEGYIDGVTEIEVYEAGENYSPIAEEGEHDWDFQNLTQEQLNMINQQVIDHYYIEDEDGNVKATYTIEEFEAGVGDDGTDLLGDNVLPAYFVCGWDGSDSRNNARHWRTWIPTYELDDNSQPTTTIASSAYAEDKTGLLDGLTLDNNHPSYSTMAIFTDKSGLFFMSKGTLKVNEVKYGQIVVLTTNTGVTVAKVDNAPEGYEFTIGQGTYVYSIDIVTPDVLPEVPEELVGVEGVKAADAKKGVRYNLAGQRVNKAYKGLVIEDGKVLLVP